jgi:hypothetical protein
MADMVNAPPSTANFNVLIFLSDYFAQQIYSGSQSCQFNSGNRRPKSGPHVAVYSKVRCLDIRRGYRSRLIHHADLKAVASHCMTSFVSRIFATSGCVIIQRLRLAMAGT